MALFCSVPVNYSCFHFLSQVKLPKINRVYIDDETRICSPLPRTNLFCFIISDLHFINFFRKFVNKHGISVRFSTCWRHYTARSHIGNKDKNLLMVVIDGHNLKDGSSASKNLGCNDIHKVEKMHVILSTFQSCRNFWIRKTTLTWNDQNRAIATWHSFD